MLDLIIKFPFQHIMQNLPGAHKPPPHPQPLQQYPNSLITRPPVSTILSDQVNNLPPTVLTDKDVATLQHQQFTNLLHEAFDLMLGLGNGCVCLPSDY